MPLYEYECGTCGVFSELRRTSDSSQPALCNQCGDESPRILSAPRLAIMGKTQRVAHERNERSANEPGTGRRSSCGCTGTHSCRTGTDNKFATTNLNPSTGTPVLQQQSKKSARPWMLGH